MRAKSWSEGSWRHLEGTYLNVLRLLNRANRLEELAQSFVSVVKLVVMRFISGTVSFGEEACMP
jgi:hypothetical protein